jgi:flagella basal body P-ring formation protein FlgA
VKKHLAIFLSFLAVLFLAGGASCLTRADVEAKISGAIKDACVHKHPGYPADAIRVSFKYDDAAFEYLAGKYGALDFVVSDDFSGFDPVGDVIIPIQVVNNGVRGEKVQVRADVKVWMDVVTATRRLDKGQIIQPDYLSLTNRDISSMSDRYMLSIGNVVGKQVTAMISKGAVLQDWMIRVQPVVSKNDQVTLVADLPSISVTAVGIAMDDGYVGDKIKVRNKDTNREVKGKISATGDVVVEMN